MAKSYTVGQFNIVLRRDDHIGPWIDISPTATEFLNAWWKDVMVFPGQTDKVVIVGSTAAGGAAIAISNDAGITWDTPGGNYISIGKDFTEVWVVPSSIINQPFSMNIWVVGPNGAWVKSTDGGLNFNNPQLFNPSSLPGEGSFVQTNAIHAIDEFTAVIAGSPVNEADNLCYVWKTIDGGNSWFDLNTNATYLAPLPPSLRNSQITGALSFTVINGGTGYPLTPPTNPSANLTTLTGSGSGAVVTLTGGPPTYPSGVVGNVGSTPTIGDFYQIGDTVRVDGGNNDCILEITSVGGGQPTGAPNGIWMSGDQQKVIVSTTYTQQISIDGGFTFTPVPPGINRSGKHLTWYPSTAEVPSHFRHVGGSSENVVHSTDGGISWDLERSNEGFTMKGAHFWSPQNGYYLTFNKIHSTSNGGITSDAVTYDAPIANLSNLEAVYTENDNTNVPCYEFVPCNQTAQSTIWTGVVLIQFSNQVVDITFDVGTPSEFTLCGTLIEITDPDVCSNALIFTPANIVNNSYIDCNACLPAPPPPNVLTECYNLISCTPKTCPDILYATDSELAPFVGQYIEINGDTTCRYLVEVTRQAYYTGLNPAVLSQAGGDFLSGIDNYTIQVTSVVVNGTEYVSGLATPYVLTPANYSVVECTDLVCVPVSVGTTENCVTNLPLYLNTVFANANVPELVAECADLALCEELGIALTKIQYSEGTNFTITFTVQNNSGTLTYIYIASAGNLSSVTIISDNNEELGFDTCNSHTQCTGNSVLLPATPINVFTECPPSIIDPPIPPIPPNVPPVELGEACETRPRFAEPGFSTKYCNPKQVVDINCKFGDSVYALFKRMRYGIETCCEYDLDKIEIKKDLMDLGALYDPDMCISGQPVPFGCCPQPCNVEAELLIPVYVTCPSPSDVIAIIDITNNCTPPTGEVVATMTFDPIPLLDCIEYTIDMTNFGSGEQRFGYFDCDGLEVEITQAQKTGLMTYIFCGLENQDIQREFSYLPSDVFDITEGPCN
tara:strand:+ start:12741 stop:15764 length:3024 start_codon:yes stop_codon:yes gene_type:complete